MSGSDLPGVIVVLVVFGIIALIGALAIAGDRAKYETQATRADLYYRQVRAEQQLREQAARLPVQPRWASPAPGSAVAYWPEPDGYAGVCDPVRELAYTRQALADLDLAEQRKELRKLRAGSLDW
ncbi:hypothetical protein [Nakamurella lactea]|uniref:hypothetical protein n=1 Tax=Nakamurella lactea TaxID=459515 RepID=UPI00042949AB|nr:hypothetical protein [Nakamurella lactea]